MLTDSAAVVAFAETDAHATMVTELTGDLPELRRVLQIDGSGAGKALEQLEQDGASVDPAELTARVEALRSEDPATLIYTSGTTGRPKGCQLTHSNLVYETRGAKAVLPTLLRQGERLLVFLPLAHVLARALTLCAFHNKVVVGFTSDIKNLVPMFAVFKPTVVVSVPAGVREGVQHRRAERRQRRQGPHLRDRRADRSRLERGARPRRPRSAAAGQARAVRSAGVPQAARGAGWRLPRVCLGRRTAGRAAGPLLPRRRSDRLRGLRADRDQRGDHRQPDRCPESRYRRKAVAGQQHAHRRRRRAVDARRRGVPRLLAQRPGHQRSDGRRLVQDR